VQTTGAAGGYDSLYNKNGKEVTPWARKERRTEDSAKKKR